MMKTRGVKTFDTVSMPERRFLLDLDRNMLEKNLWHCGNFCGAFFKVPKLEDILTQYEAEFTTKKIFRDKNGSLLYRYAFVTLFDSESMDLLEFNNGKVKLEGKEYDIAYCIDDAATLNCKYIRIDGKFYNPDKLNQSLRQK